MTRAAAVAALVTLSACAAAPAVTRSTARLVTFRYVESGGLRVQSDGAEVAQPLPGGLTLTASGLVETITLPGAAAAGGGHVHHRLAAPGPEARADLVTSASTTSGAPGEKRRVEGNVGATLRRDAEAGPIELGAALRVSQEPDYASVSGLLTATAELLDGNLSLSGALGYGHDRVSPTTTPLGQEAAWPAAHQRVNGALAATQLLSPTVALSGGVAANLQWGELAGPYRRAAVLASQLPEVVPDRRLRATAYARLSWSPWPGWGLHLRQGAYGDDWGVRGWIPEVTAAVEVWRRGLVVARYRHIEQGAARFASAIYPAPQRYLTGDSRLGRLREDQVGAEFTLRVLGGGLARSGVDLSASYDHSWFHFIDWGQRLEANVLSLSLGAIY